MKMKLLCFLLLTYFQLTTCSRPLLNRSCFEILEIYQNRFTIENYNENNNGIIKSGRFPTLPNKDAYYEIGALRSNTAGSQFQINFDFVSSTKDEESLYSFYILDPDFDRNGKHFKWSEERQYSCTINGGCVGVYDIFPSSDVKMYLNTKGTLEIFTEVIRIRVRPECEKEQYPDVGRGTIIPKEIPDVIATHCVILKGGYKTCLPMDPFYGFEAKEYGAQGTTGTDKNPCPLKEEVAKLMEQVSALQALLKIKEEENIVILFEKFVMIAKNKLKH